MDDGDTEGEGEGGVANMVCVQWGCGEWGFGGLDGAASVYRGLSRAGGGGQPKVGDGSMRMDGCTQAMRGRE